MATAVYLEHYLDSMSAILILLFKLFSCTYAAKQLYDQQLML